MVLPLPNRCFCSKERHCLWCVCMPVGQCGVHYSRIVEKKSGLGKTHQAEEVGGSGASWEYTSVATEVIWTKKISWWNWLHIHLLCYISVPFFIPARTFETKPDLISNWYPSYDKLKAEDKMIYSKPWENVLLPSFRNTPPELFGWVTHSNPDNVVLSHVVKLRACSSVKYAANGIIWNV